MKHTLDPSPNYLAYRPIKGRFNLLAIWGYALMGSGDKRPKVTFSIIDTVTGEEIALYGPITKFQAECRHHTLIRLIRVLNEQRQGDIDALWAEFRSGRATCPHGHSWVGNASWRKAFGSGTYVCRTCRRHLQRQLRLRVLEGGA